MQRYTQNYIQAGGTRAFSEYYVATHEQARFKPALQRNIVFSQHILVTDGPFNEFHVALPQRPNLLQPRSAGPGAHAAASQPRAISRPGRLSPARGVRRDAVALDLPLAAIGRHLGRIGCVDWAAS